MVRVHGGLSALVLVLSVACGPAGSPVTAPPNVILIVVDTLRADHASLYGYHRDTTPVLDEVGVESVVFDRARSQSGCTYPSVNSMLTSRYPFDFYRRGPDDMGIPEEFPSLAEILQGRGFATAAVSASPIVRATPSPHNPSAGFGRGFDTFDEQCLWKPAECVNRRAVAVVETLEEPYFLYLHYMDPHDPYRPPGTHRTFSGPYDGHEFIAAGDPNPIAEMLYDDGPTVDYGDADIQHLVDLYDDEIASFDAGFGQLVATLRSSGALDRSILIVTSDHGEEFLEHGHLKHCRGVWNTLTHVPLILRLPNGAGARRVDHPVQLVDLVPTVLDFVDRSEPETPMEGVTLRPLIEGTETDARFAFSDQARYRGVDDGRLHLILDGVENSLTLFDTHADPLEQNDLYSGSQPEAATLAEGLNGWLDRTGQRIRFDLALAAAKAQEDQLRALGYLE